MGKIGAPSYWMGNWSQSGKGYQRRVASILTGLLVGGASVFTVSVGLGQEILAPGPGTRPLDRPIPTVAMREEGQVGLAEELFDFLRPPSQLPSVGPVQPRPHFSYQFLYGTGIQNRAGNQESSSIHTVAPGILLDIGRYITFDYTPSLRFYSNDRFKDTDDHRISLTGRYPFDKVTLGLSQDVEITSTPSVELGGQADRQSYSTKLSADYAHSSKTSVELTLNQDIRTASGFNDSRQWSTLNWLDYRLFPKTHVALGAGGGYAEVDRGADMTFEQGQARVKYFPTPKVEITANGGG